MPNQEQEDAVFQEQEDAAFLVRCCIMLIFLIAVGIAGFALLLALAGGME